MCGGGGGGERGGEGHIGLELSVRPIVRYTCIRSGTVRARIMKFYIQYQHEN